VSVRAETNPTSPGGPGLTAEVLWSSAQTLLRERLSKGIFDTWVRDAEATAFSGDTLVVGVGNSYAGEVIAVRLRNEIEGALAEAAGQPVRLLVHTDGRRPEPASVVSELSHQPENRSGSLLAPGGLAAPTPSPSSPRT
jgi:chromosomal replication initiation ATPase DnaA